MSASPTPSISSSLHPSTQSEAANPHPATKPATAAHAHHFTCTFCHGQCKPPSHALGRSLRLTCDRCFRAILDLAICWRCGEVVYRDSDCVSLGWCFWHRSCYGCLFYGGRRLSRGVPVAQLFNDCTGDGGGDSEGGGKVVEKEGERKAGFPASSSSSSTPPPSRTGDGIAHEIVEVPLCAHCTIETERDCLDEAAVIRRALRRVEPGDGGMHRRRWEAALRKSTPPVKTFDNSSGLPQADGPVSELPLPGPTSGSQGFDCPSSVPLDSMIYVSMSAPLDSPCFKPSPTKPIPQWMLLSWHYRARRRWSHERPKSLLDDYLGRPSSPPEPLVSSPTSSPRNPRAFCPPYIPHHVQQQQVQQQTGDVTRTSQPRQHQDIPPVARPAFKSSRSNTSVTTATSSYRSGGPVERIRQHAHVSHEPLIRPSSGQQKKSTASNQRHVSFLSPIATATPEPSPSPSTSTSLSLSSLSLPPPPEWEASVTLIPHAGPAAPEPGRARPGDAARRASAGRDRDRARDARRLLATSVKAQVLPPGITRVSRVARTPEPKPGGGGGTTTTPIAVDGRAPNSALHSSEPPSVSGACPARHEEVEARHDTPATGAAHRAGLSSEFLERYRQRQPGRRRSRVFTASASPASSAMTVPNVAHRGGGGGAVE